MRLDAKMLKDYLDAEEVSARGRAALTNEQRKMADRLRIVWEVDDASLQTVIAAAVAEEREACLLILREVADDEGDPDDPLIREAEYRIRTRAAQQGQ